MTGASPATEQLESLRRQIARMERGESATLGKGPGVGRRQGVEGVSLGHPGIDARFQAGLLPFGVHEVSARCAGDAAPALGFALMLMARVLATRPGGRGLIVQPAGPAGENGGLYGPGLAALGLEPQRLALVQVRTPADALRVMDEALRCGAVAAVAAEVWAASHLDLSLTRRFNMSAQAHETMAILVTGEQAGTSAALTRWIAGPAVSAVERMQGRRPGRRPLLGRPALDLALTRNRRGARGGWPLGEWTVEWDHDDCSFRRPKGVGAERPGGEAAGRGASLPAPVAGPAVDRPDAAVA